MGWGSRPFLLAFWAGNENKGFLIIVCGNKNVNGVLGGGPQGGGGGAFERFWGETAILILVLGLK